MQHLKKSQYSLVYDTADTTTQYTCWMAYQHTAFGILCCKNTESLLFKNVLRNNKHFKQLRTTLHGCHMT